MRLSRADFYSPSKSFFKIEFASQDITAYGGLELIRRYFRIIELHRKVQSVFARYGCGRRLPGDRHDLGDHRFAW